MLPIEAPQVEKVSLFPRVTLTQPPGIRERDLLMDHFLADGIDQRAFVLEFLPACVGVSVREVRTRRGKLPGPLGPRRKRAAQTGILKTPLDRDVLGWVLVLNHWLCGSQFLGAIGSPTSGWPRSRMRSKTRSSD